LSETFPFRSESRFVLTADNHNSVNGLWLRALRCGARLDYVPLDAELRACDPRPWLEQATAPSLFAFPAQSNFSGVQHPLDWIRTAQDAGYRVLLDAASFAPTNPLSLASTPADFVAVSFYKIFGYPPGVGALIARRDALSILQREYFGGGTVEFVSVSNRTVRSKPGAARFEDGTGPFLAMPAVINGLRWMEELGMLSVNRHVSQLTSELLSGLEGLSDRVLVYGPHDMKARGGIVAFNLRRDGRLLNYEDVEVCARASGIAVRSGCFCNPGAAEYAFATEERRDLRPGCLRASLGIPTTRADIDRLLRFLTELASGHLSPTLPSSARAPARPPDMA
jgi:selenocysteine lyase/cysteine desulfurase